jgi:hypothetical protein
MNERDRKIEASLRSYPLVPLPGGFSRRLFARLGSKTVWKPARFRLEFVDLAIPAFMVVFNLLLFFVLAWMLNTLDPTWMLRGRLELQLLLQVQLALLLRQAQLQPEAILWILAAGWTFCLVAALLLGALLLKGPRLAFEGNRSRPTNSLS